jgi:membrane protein implicated in regulation of membrane protease activity
MKTFEEYRMLSKEAKRRIVQRYALYQIPDVAIFALILYVIHRWVGLSLGGCIGLAILWMVKYVIVFSFVWRSYDRSRPGDVTSLIGTEGIAEELLDPSGYIRVHGELWRAEVLGKPMAIGKGQTVLIEGADGLTLLVKPFEKK